MVETERRLGRYRLLGLLERDGDARIYRAAGPDGEHVELWAASLDRFRQPDASDGDRLLDRFRREAAAAAHLSHPAIPAVLASGEHGGTAFVATRAVAGPTLANLLERAPEAGRPFGFEEGVATLARVADALTAAHRAGIVHGALSADHIRGSGTATKVTGFGRTALSTPQAARHDDLAAAGRLAERLLAGHADKPAVAALLDRLRGEGTAAFSDASALRRAVTTLTAPSAAAPRSRCRPLLVAGAALASAAAMLAAAAVLDRSVARLSPPDSPAASAPREVAPTAAPAVPPSADAHPLPWSQPRRPPLVAVADAVRSLPCTLVTVEDVDERLLVSGTVAGEQALDALRDTVDAAAAGWEHGFDVAVADERFCRPLAVMAVARDANRGLAAPLTVAVASGPTLNSGDRLVLQVTAPARPVQLRIDYFTVDGSVVHLLPNPSTGNATLAAGAALRLGDKADGGRFWTIGAPYGTELLMAVATTEPLFPSGRPEQEPATDYLAALTEALAAEPDGAPAALAAASFIGTRP